MNVNAKMILAESTPGICGGGVKENNRGVNSNMIYLIYYKNLCKCHSVLPPSTTKKEKKPFILITSSISLLLCNVTVFTSSKIRVWASWVDMILCTICSLRISEI
jgi:hypothetical protein